MNIEHIEKFHLHVPNRPRNNLIQQMNKKNNIIKYKKKARTFFLALLYVQIFELSGNDYN